MHETRVIGTTATQEPDVELAATAPLSQAPTYELVAFTVFDVIITGGAIWFAVCGSLFRRRAFRATATVLAFTIADTVILLHRFTG
jgi:hypothetical protein